MRSAPSRCPDDSGPEFPTPAARSEVRRCCSQCSLARGSRTTFIEYAYRRRLLHAPGAAPFTDRGTPIEHTRSREHTSCTPAAAATQHAGREQRK